MAKVSAVLKKNLKAGAAGGMLDVVVELAESGEKMAASNADRASHLAGLKQAFERASAPVEDAIGSAGGEVVGRAWINRSLKAKVPREAVPALSQREDIRLIDAPAPLTAER